jgi:hypothetical protein
MTEKCMANCMAKPIHLHLRNKIFYYRVELPRVNNKRRYKIISLHTQNYYEAQEKIRQMEDGYRQGLAHYNKTIDEMNAVPRYTGVVDSNSVRIPEKIKNKVDLILSENTHHTIEEIQSATQRDNFMDSNEALKFGIIDEILT